MADEAGAPAFVLPQRLSATTIVLLTLPPLLWAGNAVIGRAARDQVAPFHLNFLRWLGAAVVLAPFIWRDVIRAWPVLRARLGWIALMGFLGVTSYNSLQYLALTTSSPISVTLINSSGPIFGLLLGAVFFSERVRAWQCAGAMISLFGVVWVLMHGNLHRLAQIDFESGDVLMLVATLGWSAYTWVVRKKRPAVSTAVFLFAQIVCGLVFALPLVVYESLTRAQSVRLAPATLAIVAYIAVAASLVAYFCYDRGVARAGAKVPMFFMNLTPLFAALIAGVTLGERPELYHGVGLVLIVLGIALAARDR